MCNCDGCACPAYGCENCHYCKNHNCKCSIRTHTNPSKAYVGIQGNKIFRKPFQAFYKERTKRWK